MNTTISATGARADLSLTSVFALFMAGAALLFIAGFANAAPLHSPAHDARHANGFACH